MTLLDAKLKTSIIPRDDPSLSLPRYFSALTAMISRFSTSITALGFILLASCYPYDESKDRRPVPKQGQKSVSTPDQQKIKEQRDRMKAREENKTQETVTETAETSPTPNDTVKPPAEEKRVDIPVASKVPGKEGFVFSPFNNKLINVVDIPSGTLVADPTYPATAKKHFRVP